MDSLEFIEKLKGTSAGQKYIALIQEEKSKGRSLNWERGFERHHIQPKALGGEDSEDNLVKLSVFNHILAHVYLAKALPCYDTVYAVQILSGKQKNSLQDIEKATIDEVCEWAKIRELARKYRKPHSSETIAKFVEGSKKTRLAKYGSLMSQALSADTIQKRLQNTSQKYGGDSAGQMHTPESKLARKVKMISKYGGCTTHMQSPEIVEKARQTRILHAEQNKRIQKTEEFVSWFNSHPEFKSAYRSVPKFLRERNQTREEYLTSI